MTQKKFDHGDTVIAQDVKGTINSSWVNPRGGNEYEIISQYDGVAFIASEDEIKEFPVSNPAQIELPIVPDGAIAVAYEGEQAYDYPSSWETCQQLAQDGFRVVVVEDDVEESVNGDGEEYQRVRFDKNDLQKLCDHERALAADCFGKEYLK